ncbi:MAG: response regulator transcription factor [Synechococcales cyanobacterium T60_A2020_003]|nr:response regulator transcription factor [Synechococcales cyanobacterium T60_A2020_003]
MSKIRIVLIEDHDLARIGLKTALQQHERIQVVGEAANGQQGLDVIHREQPDIAIIDIGLPDIDGIEVTRQLKELQKDVESPTRVLILSMHDNQEAVLAAFAAGADSYSVKDVAVEKLVEAIQATHEGQAWIDPAIARIVLQQAQQTPTPTDSEESQTTIDAVTPEYEKLLESDPLTEREMEVLELIVAGQSNAAIAEQLYITVGTVKTHVRNILNKLCAADRTQAAVRALRSGLVR